MLRASLEYNPVASLALQQNAVPTIHRLRLTNVSDKPLHGLRIRLEVQGLATPWQHRLPLLPPHHTQSLENIDLRFAAQELVTVVETERTDITLQIFVEETAELQEAYPLEVLPYNQWSGLRGLPELLATFVLPNHPSVQKLLTAASHLLWDWTGDPALEGYQSHSPQRARLVAAALYGAAQGWEMTYVGVPASFEKSGQKVRTPEQIEESGMANCLDLTCLLAAALEAAGLHPLLLLVEGHALCGL